MITPKRNEKILVKFISDHPDMDIERGDICHAKWIAFTDERNCAGWDIQVLNPKIRVNPREVQVIPKEAWLAAIAGNLRPPRRVNSDR